MTAMGAFDTGTRLATLCKALGNPARLAIVRYLQAQRGERSCGAIVRQLPLAQSTVSRHLRVLREAGWVEARVEPPRVRYRLKTGAVEEFRRLASAL